VAIEAVGVQQWVRGLMHGLFETALGDVGP